MTTLNPPTLRNPDALRAIIRDADLHQVIGRVAAVIGDSIQTEGMTVALGAVCELRTNDGDKRLARVIGFDNDRAILSPLERVTSVAAGDTVRLVANSFKIRTGPSLCGHVIDAFGRPLDQKPLPNDLISVDAERSPPVSLARPSINTPLQTGVRAIDTFLTCGRGQRLGIFAGSGIGKSTLLGMLARGSDADRIVIAMVGERGREVQEFIDRCLGEQGLRRSVVVVATSDAPAAQRVAAASTATAIAESFRDQGEHVLLLMDSITRFAMAQRELGLAAGEPATTRGYPPSVFNMLPRLVERAGCAMTGSITAFYTVLVEGDDPNEPISDALRGLLDGHILLDRSLAAQAHWPPIDILESLSRLQPHLVDSDLANSTMLARKLMGVYRQHQDLISIGAYRTGTDESVDRAIQMRAALQDFLQQSATEICDRDESSHQLIQLLSPQQGAAA
ncbi:MAG: FliI/YscN family ATPase [Pirellulaceae bacterium]|nr:FliI/YscN family ATPase [Pirellulaceae bacterium]